jgi:peptide chain release factor 1
MATLTLTEKLDQLGARYDELTQQLSTSEVASDSARFQKVAKQHAELEAIVEKHREFKQIEKDLAGAHQMFLEAEDAGRKSSDGAQGNRRARTETPAAAERSQ